MRILYSLLTPSPPAIASYTTSHIPTANAFFYRSLPSSPLATVSERSIRNAGLPVVPAVRPLLTGGEEASIGDVFGCLLWFDLWGPRAVPSYWQIWAASNDDSDVAKSVCYSVSVWSYCVSMTAEMFAVDEVLCCTSVQFYDLTNTDDLLKASPPLFFSLSDFPSAPPRSLFCHWHCHHLALILLSTNNFPVFQTSPRPPLATDLHASLCCTLHLVERTLVSPGNGG